MGNLRRMLKSINLTVLLLAFASEAYSAQQSFYLGFSLGQAESAGFNESDSAYKLVAGYTIENFGMDIVFVDLGSYMNNQVEQYGIAFDGMIYLPLGQGFDLFGKLGYFEWTYQVGTYTDKSTDLTYGFGGVMQMNEKFSLRAEWERFLGVAGGDVDLLTAGVTYHFQ